MMPLISCLVASSDSLDSPSADTMDYVCYAIDVCNCFSFLPIENTLMMKPNFDQIPAADLHRKLP